MKIFVVVLGLCLLVSMTANRMTRGTLRRGRQSPGSSGLTGAEAAARILEASGSSAVEVAELQSALPDHYDASRRRLYLSPANYHGTDLTALSVATHEAGHALQHADSFTPLSMRLSALKLSQIASGLVLIVSTAGAIARWYPLTYAFAVTGLAWAGILVFNLATLPVEFDASRRALRALRAQKIVRGTVESDSLKPFLRAAAVTGVGALATSLQFLAYSLLPLMGKKS